MNYPHILYAHAHTYTCTRAYTHTYTHTRAHTSIKLGLRAVPNKTREFLFLARLQHGLEKFAGKKMRPRVFDKNKRLMCGCPSIVFFWEIRGSVLLLPQTEKT